MAGQLAVARGVSSARADTFAVPLFAALLTLTAALACVAASFTPFGRFQNDWLFYLDALHRMEHG